MKTNSMHHHLELFSNDKIHAIKSSCPRLNLLVHFSKEPCVDFVSPIFKCMITSPNLFARVAFFCETEEIMQQTISILRKHCVGCVEELERGLSETFLLVAFSFRGPSSTFPVTKKTYLKAISDQVVSYEITRLPCLDEYIPVPFL